MTNDCLWAQFLEECKEVALQCLLEGHRPYGPEYDKRAQALWDDHYRDKIETDLE